MKLVSRTRLSSRYQGGCLLLFGVVGSVACTSEDVLVHGRARSRETNPQVTENAADGAAGEPQGSIDSEPQPRGQGGMGGQGPNPEPEPVTCSEFARIPQASCPLPDRSLELEAETSLGGIAIDSEDKLVYVADPAGKRVLVLTWDLEAEDEIPLSFSPYRVVFSDTEDGKRLLVTGDTPIWLDPVSHQTICTFGLAYVGVYDGSRKALYLGHDGENSLGAYDAVTCASRVTPRIDLGAKALGLALDSVRGRLYAALHHDDSVSVIDTTSLSISENFPVLEGDPTDMSVLYSRQVIGQTCTLVPESIFVAYSQGNQITRLDLSDTPDSDLQMTHIAVGWEPRYVSTNSATGQTMVTMIGTSALGLVKGTSSVSTPLGFLPHFHATDLETGCVFMTSYSPYPVQGVFRDCSFACAN